MDSRQRSVRFRDFKPMNQGDELSPLPLISPSAREHALNLKVMHSIFSEDSQKKFSERTAFDQNATNPTPTDHSMARQLHFARNEESVTKPPRWTPPGINQFETKASKTPLTEKSTPKSRFQYDYPASSIKKNGPNNTQTTFYIPGPSGILFSPAESSLSGATASNMSHIHSYFSSISGSPDTVATTSATSCYKSLPIQMLSLENIRKCDSHNDLEKIISVLETEYDYPSLLRAAKSRMIEVTNADENCNGEEEKKCTDHAVIIRHVESMPHLENMSKNREPNTLQGSGVSADTQEIVNAVNKSNTRGLTESESSLIMSLSTFGDLPGNISSDTNARGQSNISPKHNQTGDVMLEETLKSDILKIRQTVAGMGEIGHRTHIGQISNVETLSRRDLIENESIRHHNSFCSGNKNCEEMQQQLFCLQSRLMIQVEELQSKIEKVESKRPPCRNRKHLELNQLLRSAQKNLEDIKKERDSMIECLLEISDYNGIKRDDVKKLTNQQRATVVRGFKNTVTQKSHALEVMKKALSDSDSQFQNERNTRIHLEAQLARAISELQKLRQENMVLSANIQQLSQELTQSRGDIGELIYSATHGRPFFLENNVECPENTLNRSKNLQQHSAKLNSSRQSDSGVLNDSQNGNFLRVQTVELSKNLRAQGIFPVVSNLKTQGIGEHRDSFNNLSKSGDGVTADKENSQVTSSTKISSDIRRSAVRAAGGRKGLMQKMKQYQSPQTCSSCEP